MKAQELHSFLSSTLDVGCFFMGTTLYFLVNYILVRIQPFPLQMFLLVDSSAVRFCHPLCLNVTYIFILFIMSPIFHTPVNKNASAFFFFSFVIQLSTYGLLHPLRVLPRYTANKCISFRRG